MKEYGDKISADKKAPIEEALNKLKEAHKLQDIAAIDPAVEQMNAAWTAASEEMYKATQAAEGQPQGGDKAQPQGDAANAENVTDAEFEEVK